MALEPPKRALETGNEPPMYTGKEHKWAISPFTRLNDRLKSLTPTAALLAFTILINKSTTTHGFYTWLNQNYTPFQINTWWAFGITSVVYWIGGLAFMVIDLWEWPKWAWKYKLQPEIRITGRDYLKVCAVVLRNQVSDCDFAYPPSLRD